MHLDMAYFEDAVRTANEATYGKPPWMDNPYKAPENISEIAQKAIDTFLLSKKPLGGIAGIGWWQAANGYTAIALKDLYSGNQHNHEEIMSLLSKCEARRQGLINEFNDDSLWWAMCCIHMYEAGGSSNEWLLEKAKNIWKHVRDSESIVGRNKIHFRGHDMEGGCFWKTAASNGQINSISTGLYAECALRLALVEIKRTKDQCSTTEDISISDYVKAARNSLAWILRTRYRAQQGVVLDGFVIDLDKVNDWTFTYTSGVALAVAALLYQITQETEYLMLAIHMAWRGMRRSKWVEDNGALTEKNAYGPEKSDPAKNNNSVGFKSVFIRHLCTLYNVIENTGCESPKAKRMVRVIRQFVNINFQSQQERNTNGNGQYGPWWNGPFVLPTSHSQMAVLDVMAAVILVNKQSSEQCSNAQEAEVR